MREWRFRFFQVHHVNNVTKSSGELASPGLLALGDVGRDPIDDILSDAIENLTDLAWPPAVTLSCFPRGRLSRNPIQQILDLDAQAFSHLWQHV